MGFFDRFKKDKGIELTAPMKGKCVSIKEVPDPTFAEEILGKGIAVIPQDGHVTLRQTARSVPYFRPVMR